jgi:nucleoside 2-deoxyribosyltransferase
MTPPPLSSEEPTSVEAHEGAWIYVSGPMQVAEPTKAKELYERLAAAAEDSGWQVYRPYREVPGATDDAVPLVERVHYAVDYADACVFYVGTPSTGVGAELAFAYARTRPVIAVCLNGDQPSALVTSLLSNYSRARTVTGTDAQECANEVRRVLTDPDFVDIVRQATAETI